MNITKYKARLAFLLGQLRYEADWMKPSELRADLIDSITQLAYINRHIFTYTQAILDSYIEAAESVIIDAAMTRSDLKQVAA